MTEKFIFSNVELLSFHFLHLLSIKTVGLFEVSIGQQLFMLTEGLSGGEGRGRREPNGK